MYKNTDRSNKKYIINSDENKKFLSDMRYELLEFGQKFPSPKGSSYWLGDDGSPDLNKLRGTWITCRMGHVYSIGKFLGFEKSDELVDKVIMALNGELKDKINGGWYEYLDKDDKPYGKKLCYAHAFVILAASSGIVAERPQAKELLYNALNVYNQKYWDDKIGLAKDNWNMEFNVLDTYRGVNSNMHTVEAFLSVADVVGDNEYRERAGRIIKHVIEWSSKNNYRIPEHFTQDWEPDFEFNIDNKDDQFKPYGATPGHGIEWARLIIQWALSTYKNKEDSKYYIEFACRLYDRAIMDGWFSDGEPGIVYTTDWEGKPIVHDRMHWTLAEAINTSSILFNLTNDIKYLEQYYDFMEYLDEKVLDHNLGSWIHQLDRHNNHIETVWPGKSDIYHAFQSTLIPIYDPSVSICVAVKNGLRL